MLVPLQKKGKRVIMGKKRNLNPSRWQKAIKWEMLAVLFCLSAGLDLFVHWPAGWQEERTRKLPPAVSRRLIRFGNALANITDNWGLTGRDCVLPAADVHFPTSGVFCAGIPFRCPNGPAPADIKLLRKEGFTVGYSPSLRHPVWVAYRTFPTRRPMPNKPRPAFRPDPQAPRSPKSAAYTRTGYDRGHLAPNLAITRRFGEKGQIDTFYTSNICPQKPNLNRGPWYELEYCISEIWPDLYGSVWVIVGAVPDPRKNALPGGIDIPVGFYQIVVSKSQGKLRALAVYMPQTISRHAYARAHLVSIDQLEAVTGFDFLRELPDEMEGPLEAGLPTRLWPSGFFSLFKILYERFRY